MRIHQILILENDPCWDGYKRVPGTKKYEPGSCERVEEDLNEFTSGGGDQGGNYFQALASAWYNGTFDSGSLQKGIKSQEDVERLLQRGVVCPDGVTRKYSIGYNSDFDGVIISSDDYYEHADHDETDSRTGKPFGPYDYMEFSDGELDESVNEDWNKVNKKDKTSGMSRKAVKAYRRENPGSKLQTAVTTKPSKLKKGSKAAKRRKSFCARMSGNKGPMKKPNGKPTPKALALRRWNCESVEELEQLVMIAEQKINEAKNLKQQAAIAISKKKKQGMAEGVETAADIDKKIEFHKQGQAAAQYKGSMNKMHAAKIRELEAKKKALKKDVTEAFGLYGPFTVTINTGERPQSRTKTKKFRREDDAILWAEDWLEDAPQYVFATAKVTDPEGNVVWTTDEQGVAEAEKNPYPKTWHDVDKKLGKAVDKMSQAEKVKKGLAHPDTLKKQGMAEGVDQWYTVMRGNLDVNKSYHGKGDDVTGPLAKVQANAELHKTHPHDSNWTMVPASAMQKQMHETKSSPQAILARKALDRGSKKMPGMSNIVQQLVHEIKPDGTVVVKNSSDTRTMNNIKKILELGGGKNFDVVMAEPGPGWSSAKPVPVPNEPDDNKEVAEGNEGEQSMYLQGAKDIIKGADPHHIARVRNLDPDTLQRYVKLVWDKIDSKEYNFRKPDLAEVKDDDEDDGLIGGLYTPEQWAKMIANLKKKAQDQDAKKKQQERPKDLSESTDELNKLITLSGNNK